MNRYKLTAVLLSAVMLLTSLFSGCSSSRKTVMKVDGESIPAGYYCYYYGYFAHYYGAYFDDEMLDDYVTQQLKQQAAIENMAEELGIELQPLENKEIIDNTEEEIKKMGTENFNTFINGCSLSKSQYIELQKTYALYSKLFEYYYGNDGTETPQAEELTEYFKDNYYHVTHILISTQDAESDSDRDEIYKKAEEVYAKAQAGENFYDLIREYGEDPGVAENPEKGYFFGPNDSVDAAFEDASLALEENQMSEIVAGTYGYHIILRLPITEEDALGYMSQPEAYQGYISGLMSEKISAVTDNMTVEMTAAYETMDLAGAVTAWNSMES